LAAAERDHGRARHRQADAYTIRAVDRARTADRDRADYADQLGI
jgi:hypothetical protein